MVGYHGHQIYKITPSLTNLRTKEDKQWNNCTLLEDVEDMFPNIMNYALVLYIAALCTVHYYMTF